MSKAYLDRVHCEAGVQQVASILECELLLILTLASLLIALLLAGAAAATAAAERSIAVLPLLACSGERMRSFVAQSDLLRLPSSPVSLSPCLTAYARKSNTARRPDDRSPVKPCRSSGANGILHSGSRSNIDYVGSVVCSECVL